MKRNGIFQVSCCLVLLLALALCECGRGEAAVGSRRKGDRVSNIEPAAAGSVALGNGAKNLLFMQEQESTKSRDHHAARKGGKGQKEKKAPSKVLAFVKKHGGRAAAYIKCELGKKLKKSGWCPRKKRIPGIKPQPPAKPRPVKTVSDEGCVVCLYTMEKIDRSIMQVVPGDYQPGMARPYSSDDKVVIAGPDAMPIPGPGFSFLQSKFSVTERKGGKKGGKSKAKKKKGGGTPAPAPKTTTPKPKPKPAPTPAPKTTTPKPNRRSEPPKPKPPTSAGDRMTGCPPGMPFCRKPLFRIGRRSSERTLERMKKFQEESETVQKVDLAIADILKEMPENYHKVINKMDTLSTQIAHQYLHDYTNDDICVDIGFCDPLLLQTTQSSVFT